MNLKEVKEIINLLQNSDIDELEIEREGVRIRVKKTPGVQHVPIVHEFTLADLPAAGACHKRAGRAAERRAGRPGPGGSPG